MLDELNRVGFGYRWMRRFIFLDKTEVIIDGRVDPQACLPVRETRRFEGRDGQTLAGPAQADDAGRGTSSCTLRPLQAWQPCGLAGLPVLSAAVRSGTRAAKPTVPVASFPVRITPHRQRPVGGGADRRFSAAVLRAMIGSGQAGSGSRHCRWAAHVGMTLTASYNVRDPSRRAWM